VDAALLSTAGTQNYSANLNSGALQTTDTVSYHLNYGAVHAAGWGAPALLETGTAPRQVPRSRSTPRGLVGPSGRKGRTCMPHDSPTMSGAHPSR
jgi:hypothetical protein